jgi:hypothetical protein
MIQMHLLRTATLLPNPSDPIQGSVSCLHDGLIFDRNTPRFVVSFPRVGCPYRWRFLALSRWLVAVPPTWTPKVLAAATPRPQRPRTTSMATAFQTAPTIAAGSSTPSNGTAIVTAMATHAMATSTRMAWQTPPTKARCKLNSVTPLPSATTCKMAPLPKATWPTSTPVC